MFLEAYLQCCLKIKLVYGCSLMTKHFDAQAWGKEGKKGE